MRGGARTFLGVLACTRVSAFPTVHRTRVALRGVVMASLSSSSESASASATTPSTTVDREYPGTAVERMEAIRERARSLTTESLSQDFESARKLILWAGGLRDLQNAMPGYGYTGHSFSDWNHCDLTAMHSEESTNENQGAVQGIAYGNQLGPGIKIASLEELGPGGSWSTCIMGCNQNPPRDVAHLQFKARIAFKLVWAPPAFTTFVLVDDDGKELARGKPSGGLPPKSERSRNYAAVKGSKYAAVAEEAGAE